jgi:rare lipoprotein A (peptidoglycan hydrolase)/cytoskeletal protein CcmA (bactofilin family)
LSKTPGDVHCYHLICHRVLTIAETESRVGSTRILVASYYDDPRVDRSNTGELTSSGEKFDADNSSRAASSIFPDGTELLVWNPLNGRAAHVRINDFGPFRSNRTLDVTKGLAKQLDITRQGVIALRVTVLAPPPPSEPTYRSFRTYPKTKGYLGVYDEEALIDIGQKLVAESESRNATALADAVAVTNIPLPKRKPSPRFGPHDTVRDILGDTIRPATQLSEHLFDVSPQVILSNAPPLEAAIFRTPALTQAIDVQPVLVVALDQDAYGRARDAGIARLKFANYVGIAPARAEVWNGETGALPNKLTVSTLVSLIAAALGMIFFQRLNRASIIATSARRTRLPVEHPLPASEESPRTSLHQVVPVIEPRVRSSIIGRELQVSGCLISTNDVIIEGSIDGDCVCRHLVIKPSGKLTGDVIAEEVLVEGAVRGRVLAKTVGLASRAVVVGDVAYCDLIVERRGTLEATVRRISRDAWLISGEDSQFRGVGR